jgi:aspartate/tyrosine/aromatic aminotransferase
MEKERIQKIIDHYNPNFEETNINFEDNNTKMKDENEDSIFGEIKLAPPDAILGLNKLFKEDTFKDKVNLGVGAYRDENGKPYVLKVVREIEKDLVNENLDKEYIPQEGLKEFLQASALILFGEDSKPLKDGRVVSIQSIRFLNF